MSVDDVTTRDFYPSDVDLNHVMIWSPTEILPHQAQYDIISNRDKEGNTVLTNWDKFYH